MEKTLKNRLMNLAFVIAGLGAGGAVVHVGTDSVQVSPEVLIAMEIGDYMEGYKLTPYRDTGGVLTVCRGITGSAVIPGKTYTDDECKTLELKHYQQIEKQAKSTFKYWSDYNMWVKASFLDMIYNLGIGQVGNSTMLNKANEGDLTGACMAQPQWVWGRNRQGVKVKLGGLVKRRDATKELCLEWGKDGHFSDVGI